MKTFLKKLTPVRVLDVLFSAWCIVWFFLPVTAGVMEAGSSVSPESICSFYLPFYFMEVNGKSIQGFVLFLLYLIPLWGFIKLLFLALLCFRVKFAVKIRSWFSPSHGISVFFRIFLSAVAVYAAVLPMLLWAVSSLWFAAYPLSGWIGLVFAVSFHCCSVIYFLRGVNERNPAFAEYKEFIHTAIENKKTAKKEAREKRLESRAAGKNAPENAVNAVRTAKNSVEPKKTKNAGKTGYRNPKASSSFEVLLRIRSKLFIAFIGIILAIILSVSFLVLIRYKSTIMQMVSDMAQNQVIQASTTYRVNLGDSIAMTEYLIRQREINDSAEFRYIHLNIYTNLQTEILTENLPENLPDFKLEYTTEIPEKQFPPLPALEGIKAAEYLRAYLETDGKIPPFYDSQARIVRFVMPVIVRGSRVIGFSVLDFNRDIITKSYFQTKISVFIITLFSIYIAVILTYCIGNYIVNPLLFLRMNVRKISDVLSNMISGNMRISSSALVYQDYVKSRDEIKALSREINDMVTVIRGIVPYISASTLKQAEKGTATTSRRNLAFLFTDIRGFTTLCEGMKPEEVVSILNHYLNLETEIILSNHGDVDKFVGDEVMGFFEGPDKELNACRAAMQLCAVMAKEREERLAQGKPVVSIGIGINTGSVVFGSVGAHDRMDFTSIGDTVNLAARLEGANKVYMSKAIITEAVYSKIEERFICRELDFIAVKGKNEPVRIYELLQEAGKADDKILKLKASFEKGLSYYRKKNWAKAEEIFKKCMETYGDGPSEVFLERTVLFSKNPPPPGWDGVFRMTVK